MNDFEGTEAGAGLSFTELSPEAREIAKEFIEACDSENKLIALLDQCVEYREATGETDWDKYPKSVDAVVRYWRWPNGVAEGVG